MNIAICGFGRAGKAMAAKVLSSKEHDLVAVFCRPESKNVGTDIGSLLYPGKSIKLDVNIMPLKEVLSSNHRHIDVVVDFSSREMALPLLDFCGQERCSLVICTTNHSSEIINGFKEKAEHYNIGVTYAPNLTIGINLLMDFVHKMSNVLPGFDFEVIERHPKDKAKKTMTAKLISKSIGRGDIPIHSVRMDGYVGVHEVISSDGVERLTITHESLSRQAFANGAILAAEFTVSKRGYFTMRDVIAEIERRTCLAG